MVNTAPNGPESAEAAQRREALAALVARTDTPTTEATPVVVPSGREVYCGGDVRRLLVKRFSSIGYRLPPQPGAPMGVYMRTKAVPGDTVFLLESEAARLDALGVTVPVDEDKPAKSAKAPKAATAPVPGALWTDEQVKAAKAGEVVAYVAQHPDERPRVRAIEEARTGKGKGAGPRATVLKATEETPETDTEAELEHAARQDAADAPPADAPEDDAEQVDE